MYDDIKKASAARMATFYAICLAQYLHDGESDGHIDHDSIARKLAQIQEQLAIAYPLDTEECP